jgi:hypothetical protein
MRTNKEKILIWISKERFEEKKHKSIIIFFFSIRVKCKASAKYGLSLQPRLVDIIAAIPESYKKVLLPKIKAKPVRTASGVRKIHLILFIRAILLIRLWLLLWCVNLIDVHILQWLGIFVCIAPVDQIQILNIQHNPILDMKYDCWSKIIFRGTILFYLADIDESDSSKI